MELWHHQKRILEKNPSKVLAVHGLGSGKTRTACEWGKLRAPALVLIVCPKGLKENWKKECELWGLKNYKIISKEEFKKLFQGLYIKVVIIDEADHFFSPFFKSQMSKALRWYIKNINPDIFMATGTPYRSSAWNIYTAGTLLGHNWSFNWFKYEFFDEVRMGHRFIPVPKKGSDQKLKNLIESIADVFRTEDGFDIPPQIDETIHTGESKEQIGAKKSNKEILPIVRFTQDHKIEAGIGINNDNKLEVILEYAKNEQKLAIVCRYREQLENYAQALKGEGYEVLEIHGDIKNRQEVVDQVEKKEKCIVLLQSATCEGYELPSIACMIFASLDFSYRNYQQIRGRILRMNRLHKNIYIHLLAGKSDKAVMEAMNNKKDFDVLKYYDTKNK